MMRVGTSLGILNEARIFLYVYVCVDADDGWF